MKIKLKIEMKIKKSPVETDAWQSAEGAAINALILAGRAVLSWLPITATCVNPPRARSSTANTATRPDHVLYV